MVVTTAATHQLPPNAAILWIRRQSVAIIVALIILAGTGLLRWWTHLMPENTNVPVLRAPSPNAYDYYIQAASLVRDSQAVWWVFAYPPHSAPAIGDILPIIANHQLGRGPISVAEQQILVNENAAALDKLRLGMNYPHVAQNSRSLTSPDLDLANDRTLGRLLIIEGDLDASRNDWSTAANAYLDAIKFGNSLTHGSTEAIVHIGTFVQEEARKRLQIAVSHLDAVQARQAAIRLQAIDAMQAPTPDVIRNEMWWMQSALLSDFHNPQWRKDFLRFNGYLNSDTRDDLDDPGVRFESPRAVYDNYTAFQEGLIKQASLPWPQMKQAEPPLPKDPINGRLRATSLMTFFLVRNIACNRLIETQLALRAYYLDRGSYPTDLPAMTPHYLSTVPIDPFSNNQPLRYRRKGPSYLLYSIGPDAVDDGGVPIINKSAPPGESHRVYDPNVTGDIVVGVNSLGI